jgi:hypothetical protein
MSASPYARIRVAGEPYRPPRSPRLLTLAFDDLDVRLPASYRAFCERFGFGLLFGFFLFYVPGTGPDSLEARSAEMREMLRVGMDEGLFDYGPDGSKELVTRLLPFGSSENGHTIAWHVPPGRTPTSEGEWEIYLVASRYCGVRKLSSSFHEFIELCLDPVRARLVFGGAVALFDDSFEPT